MGVEIHLKRGRAYAMTTQMKSPRYGNGETVKVGDVLSPGHEQKGQISRVVVVIATEEAVPGFDASEWRHLKTGVVVEHITASGSFLVHYPEIDADFELLRRDS